jgi:hypothetical protein
MLLDIWRIFSHMRFFLYIRNLARSSLFSYFISLYTIIIDVVHNESESDGTIITYFKVNSAFCVPNK